MLSRLNYIGFILRSNKIKVKLPDLSIEKNDRYCNQHRQGKTSVQAYLNDEEISLINHVKAQRKFSSYRELLVTLCREEEKKQRLTPTEIKAKKNTREGKQARESKKRLLHDINIFQLKITSVSVKPMIWREVLVPASMNLSELHQCVMELFGLEGCHLYEFGSIIAPYHTKKTLSDVFQYEKIIEYRYDFCDNWEFVILKQKSITFNEKQSYPYCIKSKGGMMLEDCGASYGYKLITNWCRKKTPSARSALLNYYCGDEDILEEYEDFNPDFFDINAFNQNCTKYENPVIDTIKKTSKDLS